MLVFHSLCVNLKPCQLPTYDVLLGAQSALRRRLPVHLRRRVQEGGAALHGGQHPADAVLRRQHPHPVSLPPPLRQGGVHHTITLHSQCVCVCVSACSDWLLFVSVQCVNAGMDTLTLARYYCELSLMDMDMVIERGSLLASACLLMALVTKDLGGWVGLRLIGFFSLSADNS